MFVVGGVDYEELQSLCILCCTCTLHVACWCAILSLFSFLVPGSFVCKCNAQLDIGERGTPYCVPTTTTI